MTDVIDEVFGPGGILAKAFPGYSPREGQIRFARAALETIANKEILLADAPTGTGKSVAYLVPVIAHLAANSGGKAVIVTSNIALQEQLIKKDLPMLQAILPWPFNFEIAKGFSNYVCKDALDEADTNRLMGSSKFQDPEHDDILRRVLEFDWKEGDLSEFPEELPYPVKRLAVISSDDCQGKKCRHYDDCFPRAAKKRFGKAQIIVTNYHMYAIDLQMHHAGNDRGILPEHDIVVFDEAHTMASVCRSYFGDQITLGSIKALVAELDAGDSKRAQKLGLPRAIDPITKVEVIDAAERLFGQLRKIRDDKEIYQARIKEEYLFDSTRLCDMMQQAAEAYSLAAVPLMQEAADFCHGRAEKLLTKAAIIHSAQKLDRDGWIFYLGGEGEKVELSGEPLDVGPFLESAIWKADRKPRAKILCSATLATGTGSSAFDFAVKQLGIPEDGVAEILVESPFDFSRSVLIVPDDDFPDPTNYNDRRAFQDAVSQTVYEVAMAAGGRTMALFTSYYGLEAVARYLQFKRVPFPVYKQGQAPRTELVKRFKERPGVLLGTDSFWEGVDCPGETLVALVIDKLPFDHMHDPVLDAVKSRDPKGWFDGYYLQKALVKWRQGFGRLIRSVSDYGIVVCCDKRLVTKGYGKKFRKSLPRETLKQEGLEDIKKLLDSLKNGHELDLVRVA